MCSKETSSIIGILDKNTDKVITFGVTFPYNGLHTMIRSVEKQVGKKGLKLYLLYVDEIVR